MIRHVPQKTDKTDELRSRKWVADRWGVSTETIKRRTKEGLLHPVRFNTRLIRYRLSEILAIEEGGGI